MQKKQLQTISLIVLAMIIGIFLLFVAGGQKSSSTNKRLNDFREDKGAFKTGVVTSASSKLLSIQTENGIMYWFSMDNHTNFECTGENLGDTVSIEYEGEYTDFMLAKSVSVTEEATDNSFEIPEKLSHINSYIKHTAGITTDITKNYITIAPDTDSEDTLTISKGEYSTTDENIAIGDSVRVYFREVYDDNPMAVDIRVISPKPEKKLGKSKTPSSLHYITGMVLVTEGKTAIISKDGHNYRIEKSDTIISDDISVGDTARIYYTGSFLNGMTASCIEKMIGTD